MDEALWAQTVEVFHAALECPEHERTAFVKSAADCSPEILEQVLTMLAADRSGVSRVGRGVAEAVDSILEDAEILPPLVPPPRIGPYEIKEFLGRGGMGAVWKAERTDTGQAIAIKFLLPMAEFPAERRRRFAEEIATLARLRHPHIVCFHDAGALSDRTPWFVMDYVEEYRRGLRFTTYCRLPEHGIEEQLRLFRTVCDAVLYAHLQGTIHRDLKPSNILVAKDGTPRIVDFGIARRVQDGGEPEAPTSPSQRFISDHYAAPEWKRYGQVGTYTDVYSLGVMLYEILTGRHPLRQAEQASGPGEPESGNKPPEKPSRVAPLEKPARPGEKLSRSAWNDLDKLCLKAMHEDRLERYQSVESLIRDVDHYLNNEPLDAQPRMLRYRTEKFVRRNRRAVLASAAAFALVVLMAVFFTWRLARERNAAREDAARVRHIQEFMTGLLQGGDQEAGPAANLLVTKMIDRGVEQAGELSAEPQVQADLYQTLGTMSQKLGRPQQADSLLQKALDERQTFSRTDPDAVANNRMALALVRSEEGKTKEAEQLARQALNEIERHDPDNRTSLGKTELALGTVLIAAGKQKDALPVLKQAAEALQPNPKVAPSPELARTFATLGDAEIYLGDYAQGESYDRMALASDRQIYGDNHPHIGEDLSDLAQVYEVQGRYAEAEPLERQAVSIMRQWYGPEHPETARKMTTLASTLLYENKTDEANELLRHALTIQEGVYGREHPKVAYVVNCMGFVDLHEKRFDQAEEDYRRAAEIYRQAYGDGDYRVAVALDNLASVYQAEKRYPECERLLLDVVDRFTRAFGASNIQTGISQVRLGRTLLHEEKYAEAALHSQAGYDVLSKQTSSTTSFVEGARHDLAIEYAALGQLEKARQFGAQLTEPPAIASR